MTGKSFGTAAAASLIAMAAAGPLAAQDRGITYNFYGTPGLLEMPIALVPRDGDFITTLGATLPMQRTTLTFQVSPRLMASYRFSTTQDYSLPGDDPFIGTHVDRSIDLRFSLLDETANLPAVSIGLQDFLGTGQFGGEYIVASKAFGDSLRVTAGLGWGRYGTQNGFTNPLASISDGFETRDDPDGSAFGGQWFHGDAAFFGGLEYALSDKFTIKAEYSSDAFERESELGLIEIDSPINAGITWNVRPGIQVGAHYLYGNTVGLTASVLFNPNDRPFDGGFDPAPVPVRVRGADERGLGWDRASQPAAGITAQITQALAAEGIDLQAIELTDGSARIRYANNRYRTEAQAMGRAARVLTRALPASIETITLEPTTRGIPTSAVTVARSDLESLEVAVGGADALLARANIGDAGPMRGLTRVAPADGGLTWGLAPYAAVDFGNFAVSGGVEASATFEVQPNLVLTGALRHQLFNTADAVTEGDGDGLEPVRTNSALYTQEAATHVPYLTLAHYGRPAPNLYSRVTAGLLEPMFGGVSGEVLYKPVQSNWAVGAEVAYVRQREFDQLFEFQDYETITGHGSVYYAFDNGFHGQLDVGRYLAGDWGATLSVDRGFENGWRFGAFATVTEHSFDGEIDSGVDYGLRVDIPIDFVIGRPTQSTLPLAFGAPERDDGQRLNVDGRLYEGVRDGHFDALDDSWGRFWR